MLHLHMVVQATGLTYQKTPLNVCEQSQSQENAILASAARVACSTAPTCIRVSFSGGGQYLPPLSFGLPPLDMLRILFYKIKPL